MSGELPIAPEPLAAKRELRFECTKCGLCCTTRGEYAYVYLNPAELRRIAAYLGIGAAEFRRRYTKRDEYGWTQLSFAAESCVFLDERGRCSVHPVRPTQCRTFPFWPEFVTPGGFSEEVKGLCEGIDQGPVWPEAEVRSLIEETRRSEEE